MVAVRFGGIIDHGIVDHGIVDEAEPGPESADLFGDRFAGLSGGIEFVRSPFANRHKSVTCTYTFWRCMDPAI